MLQTDDISSTAIERIDVSSRANNREVENENFLFKIGSNGVGDKGDHLEHAGCDHFSKFSKNIF